METLIIEEISKGYKLLNRHKFNQDNIDIGRGYNNDIIVNDPHVSPQHLSLSYQDGHWLVTDHNSINGSFLDDSKAPADQHIINSGDIITIGKSQVRVLFADHPVADAIEFSPFESLINFARQPTVLIAAITLFTIVVGYMFFLNKASETTFSQLLVPAIGISIMFACWPLGVSLVSHLTKNDARTMSQLGVCFIFFNLMWMSDLLEAILAFNFSSHWPIVPLFALVPIALAFCMFWFNCYVSFHMSAQRRMAIAAGLTLLFFGGSFVIDLSNKPEFNPRPEYNATVMPPALLMTPNTSVEAFIANSDKLFEKASKAAQEK